MKGRVQSTRTVRRKAPAAVLQLVTAQPDNEPETADISPEDLPIEDRIRAAFGQGDSADHATVHLYRVMQNNKPEEYLFACGPDDLDGIMDRVRDTFGTGTYRVRVYINRKIATQFDFSVYVPPKPAVPVAPPVDNALATVLQRQNEMLERMMERLSAPAAAAPVDRLAEIAQLADVLKKLAPERAPSGFDLASLSTLLPIGKQLLEIFREFSGGGGSGETNILDVIRDLVKELPLADIVGAVAGARPGGAVPAAHPALEPPPPASPPQTAPASTGNPLFDVLRQPIAFLVTRAARNAPVEAAADWMFSTLALEGVPDEVLAALLERPDLLQVLVAIVPEVAAHSAWFEKLIAEARRAMFETDEIDENVAGKPAADPAPAATG